GEAIWAAHLWGAAAVLREASSRSDLFTRFFQREPADYEHLVSMVRGRLGERVFTNVWAEGQTMTPGQAMTAHALPLCWEQTWNKGTARTRKRQVTASPYGLTAREEEVLRLVVQGLGDAQIAQVLVISPRTVNAHLRSIYGKLNVKSRAGATRVA